VSESIFDTMDFSFFAGISQPALGFSHYAQSALASLLWRLKELSIFLAGLSCRRSPTKKVAPPEIA
jgi:hypothetical protein